MNLTNLNLRQAELELEYPGFSEYVPDLWLQFDQPSLLFARCLSVIFFIITVIAISGNGLVLYVYIQNSSLRTPSNRLLISLAMADLLMMFKSWVLIINAWENGPFLGMLGCLSFGSLGNMAGLAQIWTLTMIAYDRAMAIFYPLRREKRMRHGQVKLIVLGIWVAALFFSMCPLLGINSYVAEGYLYGCSFNTWATDVEDIAYIYILIVLAYVIPMLIIFYCYIKIYFHTRLSNTSTDFASDRKKYLLWLKENGGKEHILSPENLEIEKKHKVRFNFQKKKIETERKLARMVFVLIAVWTASWTPYTVVAILQLLRQNWLLHPALGLFAMLMAKFSSLANTFIYGLRLPKVRRKLVKLFGKKKRNAHSFGPDDLTTVKRSSKSSNRIEDDFTSIRLQELQEIIDNEERKIQDIGRNLILKEKIEKKVKARKFGKFGKVHSDSDLWTRTKKKREKETRSAEENEFFTEGETAENKKEEIEREESPELGKMIEELERVEKEREQGKKVNEERSAENCPAKQNTKCFVSLEKISISQLDNIEKYDSFQRTDIRLHTRKYRSLRIRKKCCVTKSCDENALNKNNNEVHCII
ncbi:opsin, ultraviolet-sensitive [Eurytemora carolleeae]|uniref:opsin, ultraviolet-sensitive n=1 Tax=Eurytemora carolleeae TaxID=1294199 RepID=UPI000C75ED54|nr:opsin, ultraviolet-sensitive [Eurytemora carolleeae]|eukprot:XP_023340528.1 opsin, ultraviolet-sensitive-like [Eurytemora affinis]